MICIPCNVCVPCIVLIIKCRECCFVSVFDGESTNPATTTTMPPLPPIMYITFASAWFMQILICISLFTVLSAGWNPSKPIVNTALHQILLVTFPLFICDATTTRSLKCKNAQPTNILSHTETSLFLVVNESVFPHAFRRCLPFYFVHIFEDAQQLLSFKLNLAVMWWCWRLTNDPKYSSVVIKWAFSLHIKVFTEKLFNRKTSFTSVFKVLHQHPVPVPLRVTPSHFLMSFTWKCNFKTRLKTALVRSCLPAPAAHHS